MDLLDTLSKLATRHAEVAELLALPDATGDMEQFTKLSKEYSDLTPVVEAYVSYKKMREDKDGAYEILKDSSADADMKELAQMEYDELLVAVPEAEHALKIKLLPKDEADERNVILEIRAGTGGDEAALFVGDVFRMYANHARLKGWKVEVQSESVSESGGYKEIIAKISGDNVYQQMKYESGTHRVQRVPETESQGRVHTSAITVAILPEAEEVDVQINPADLRIDTYRSQGAGGQHVNTTDSAVRITHIPTGVVAACQDGKSQHKNKDMAMKMLLTRILDAERSKADKARSDARKSMVGSGDRSQRIRTYNFPQSRVTDHRISLTLHSLDAILMGEKLDDLIIPLTQADQADKLAALAE